jgi:2-dehydropantoate 2-reductase
MNVLVVGSGVIGTVYGAVLASSGANVDVLDHGARTAEVATKGLRAYDVAGGGSLESAVRVVPDAHAVAYDLVLVAVTRERLAAACAALVPLLGEPVVLTLGNNPSGRLGIPDLAPARVRLGFPGIGGTLVAGVANYIRITQQPTALEACDEPYLSELAAMLDGHGFAVQRVGDMDGWLAYHALFVACIAAALYRCGTDPVRLALDRKTLRLMCRAITEGFAALRREDVGGLPRNLAVLHHHFLAVVAVRYWRRTMRSPVGELCFAAHARHAEIEMRALGTEIIGRIGMDGATADLRTLLRDDARPPLS